MLDANDDAVISTQTSLYAVSSSSSPRHPTAPTSHPATGFTSDPSCSVSVDSSSADVRGGSKEFTETVVTVGVAADSDASSVEFSTQDFS